MSKKVEAVVNTPVENKDDIFHNEADDNEQLDEESQKALNNAKFDLNDLIGSKTGKKNEKTEKKASNKKSKNKGQDFVEYAQKNGLNYNIQYEEKDNREKKQYPKKENTVPNTQNTQNPSITQKPFVNYNNDQKSQNFQKKGKVNNNKKYKNNYNSEGGNVGGHIQGSNKFDSFNYNMMIQNPYFNPNMIRPEFKSPGNYGSYEVTQDFQKIVLDENNNSDKNIVDSLNYYFSIENLNKDFFIRSKLNEEGYLEAEEIINFNKMKLNAVTIEKIQNILEEFKTTIETKVENEKLYLRNLNWETIKNKLLPLEQIQNQKKKENKIQNTNYVHMQNNYYYQFSPHMMYPHNMELNPYMNAQMMGGFPQMPMFNQYQIPPNYNFPNTENN